MSSEAHAGVRLCDGHRAQSDMNPENRTVDDGNSGTAKKEP